MIARAVRRRCPRCGGDGWFDGWFKKGDRCVTCGYAYERQDGFMLGAVTMNTMLTFGLIALALVIGLVATAPDFATLQIMLICGAIGLMVPIVFFPFSYTLWAAVDLAMRPMEPAEIADALTWLAAQHRSTSRDS